MASTTTSGQEFYLVPTTLSFEMEACAHLHPQGGVFVSRDAYWKIKDIGMDRLRMFLTQRISGMSEEEAVEKVEAYNLRLRAWSMAPSRNPSLIASSNGVKGITTERGL